jgi:hypothetical protein
MPSAVIDPVNFGTMYSLDKENRTLHVHYISDRYAQKLESDEAKQFVDMSRHEIRTGSSKDTATFFDGQTCLVIQNLRTPVLIEACPSSKTRELEIISHLHLGQNMYCVQYSSRICSIFNIYAFRAPSPEEERT